VDFSRTANSRVASLVVPPRVTEEVDVKEGFVK
jgi:hypothetical protein